MQGWLRQSTETTRIIGPFIDPDGVTEETGLAGNATEIRKEGGSFAAGPVLGTHDADGYYPVTFTTANTNTPGSLRIKSHDSTTHLPVWEDFLVVPANVYDSVVLGTDTLQADVTQINGTSATAGTKTGFSLAADGLDLAIPATEPTAKPTTGPGMLRWLIQRFWKADKSTTAIVVKTEAGATVTTQTITDDNAGTETLGAPS